MPPLVCRDVIRFTGASRSAPAAPFGAEFGTRQEAHSLRRVCRRSRATAFDRAKPQRAVSEPHDGLLTDLAELKGGAEPIHIGS